MGPICWLYPRSTIWRMVKSSFERTISVSWLFDTTRRLSQAARFSPDSIHCFSSADLSFRVCFLERFGKKLQKSFQPVAQKSALSWRLPFQRRTISGHDAAAASLCIRRASRACSRRCVDELQISSFGTAGVVESASLSLSLGAAIWPTFGSIVTLFGPGSTETLFGFTAGFGLTSGFFGSTIGASAGLALAGLPLQAAAASEQEAFLLGQNWSMRPLKIAFRSGSPKPSFSKVSAASNWSDSEVPFTFEADGPNLGWWWTHPFSKKKGVLRFHLRTENWPMETNMTIWRVKENFTKTNCWLTLTSHPKRQQAASLQTPVGSIPADPGLKFRTTSVDQNFAKHFGFSGGNSSCWGKCTGKIWIPYYTNL